VSQELYVPRVIDVAWATKVTSILRDGGRLGIPMNGAVYAIDKERRVFARVFRGLETDWDHDRQKCVFGLIGYGVEDLTGEANVPDRTEP
jgi:hypothetical protein